MFSDRSIRRLLLLLLLWGWQFMEVGNVFALEDSIPLGEEVEEIEPDHTLSRGGVLGVIAAGGWDGDHELSKKIFLSLGLWGAESRILLDPDGDNPLRWGSGFHRGSWSLGWGRLGSLPGGILNGGRDRPGLGSVGPPVPSCRYLRPATSNNPRVRGAVLQGMVGSCHLDLRLMERSPTVTRSGERGRSLGVTWGVWRMTVFDASLLRGLSLWWRGSGVDSPVSVEVATAGPPHRPLARRGLRWRVRETRQGVLISASALVITGPRGRARLPESWLTGEGGRELHLSLSGVAGAGNWRLARRIRNGLGSGEESHRTETGLVVKSPLHGGRLEVRTRRLEIQREVDLQQSPGFPRSQSSSTVRQELRLRWRRGLQVGWTWRGGEGEGGTMLELKGTPPGPVRLELDLRLFDLDPGMLPFMAFEGGQLHRRLVALRGSGWRLGARHMRSGMGIRLMSGVAIGSTEIEGFHLSSWLEIRH